ncbi:hypothetical protein Golob_003563 [Gossypium lobatum]|uniref:Uncharacterized protein n=1 Tax=Gossypium lobatum TaxID=34289 RepID=A0A7J8MZ45_9ROSI|nr:hypothetical protein [Gossypium lobatum]
MSISKSKDGDADGGVVELKKHNNRSSPPSYSTSTISSDTYKYHVILKNKLYEVCTTVALSYTSAMKVEGLSTQVQIQALQLDLMLQSSSDTGTRCAVMGKVPPNEYFFSRVLVANDLVDDFDKISGDSIVGNLMASTGYSIHCRLIPEESVVLLENGALFLFDLVSYVNFQKLNGYVKGSELRFLWDDLNGAKNYKWLGIEFNLYPRILVVSQSYVALLLDFIHDECNVICLGKIEMLSFYVVVDKGLFLSFFKARADGFQYVLTSKDLVLNFDVAHKEPLFNFEDSLQYFLSDDGYEIPKRFKYVNLNYLHGYLNGNLAEGLGFKMSSLALSFLFNNISLATSICKATTRQIWETFPLKLLLLVFSSHPELLDVPFDDMAIPLEFSIVPDLPQLPPFLLGEPSCCSTKWSHKM